MRKLVQLALQGYKRWISPMLPVACRYVPTCSEYAEEAVERYGAIRGGAMAVWRLLRCHPFGGSGYDPVDKSGKWKVGTESECAADDHAHGEPRAWAGCARVQQSTAVAAFTGNSKVEVRNS